VEVEAVEVEVEVAVAEGVEVAVAEGVEVAEAKGEVELAEKERVGARACRPVRSTASCREAASPSPSPARRSWAGTGRSG
jgi:hypothetical protein